MRALQPSETRMSDGTSAFETSDEVLYLRGRDGSIRRGMSKEQQRTQRKAEKKARRHLNEGPNVKEKAGEF